MSDLDSTRLVFIGGLHRSGTTPLARAMAEHPAISGLRDTGVKEDEGQHLQSVYPKAKVYGGPGRFALDKRSHLTEKSPLVTEVNARALFDAWAPYWDLGRPLLLEKSPPNLVMGRFLQAMYPGSAFIAVVRHPIVVALSTVKWRRLASKNFQNHTTVHAMVEHWLTAHETLRDDMASLSRTHLLRYEDLVDEPDRQLKPVQQLLDLRDPIPSGSLRSTHSDRYEQTWSDLSTGSWLDRRKRRSIEQNFGDRVAAFGYDISDLATRQPFSLADPTGTAT